MSTMGFIKFVGDVNWYKILTSTDTKIYYYTKTSISSVDFTINPGKDSIEDTTRDITKDQSYIRSALV